MRLKIPNVIGRTKTGGEIRRSGSGNIYTTKGHYLAAVGGAKHFPPPRMAPIREQISDIGYMAQKRAGWGATRIRTPGMAGKSNSVETYRAKTRGVTQLEYFAKYSPTGRVQSLIEVASKGQRHGKRTMATEVHIVSSPSARGRGTTSKLLDRVRAQYAVPPAAMTGGSSGVTPAGRRFFQKYVERRHRSLSRDLPRRKGH